MRLLSVDIGNTHVKFGVFDDETLAADFSLPTDPSLPAHQVERRLSQMLALHAPGISLQRVEGVAVVSVVPDVTATFSTVVHRYAGVELFVVTSRANTGLTIAYETPETLGGDRLVNAAAAFHFYGAERKENCLVVDYGTATKIEAVTAAGVYCGGAILPGIGISTDALFSRAALLRKVELTPPPRAIGANSSDALRSGILYGFAAQTEGLVARMKQEMEGETCVIATGGFAPLIAPLCPSVDHIDPHLTLQGLRLLYTLRSPQ